MSGDQFPRKVTTCSRHYKPKLILPLKSVLLYNIPFTLKIAFEKMKLFKMHQIIKPTCPSRQLFIKITFAFIKIFDFLVKIAIFGAFLFWSRDSHYALCYCPKPTLDCGSNAWRESLDRKRNAPKMAILTRKSKIFIKAIVIFMKSCSYFKLFS